MATTTKQAKRGPGRPKGSTVKKEFTLPLGDGTTAQRIGPGLVMVNGPKNSFSVSGVTIAKVNGTDRYELKKSTAI